MAYVKVTKFSTGDSHLCLFFSAHDGIQKKLGDSSLRVRCPLTFHFQLTSVDFSSLFNKPWGIQAAHRHQRMQPGKGLEWQVVRSSEPEEPEERPKHSPRGTFVKHFSSSNVVPPWKTERLGDCPWGLPTWVPFSFGFHLGIANGNTHYRSEREESSWVIDGMETAYTSSLALIVHISCHSASRYHFVSLEQITQGVFKPGKWADAISQNKMFPSQSAIRH